MSAVERWMGPAVISQSYPRSPRIHLIQDNSLRRIPRKPVFVSLFALSRGKMFLPQYPLKNVFYDWLILCIVFNIRSKTSHSYGDATFTSNGLHNVGLSSTFMTLKQKGFLSYINCLTRDLGFYCLIGRTPPFCYASEVYHGHILSRVPMG